MIARMLMLAVLAGLGGCAQTFEPLDERPVLSAPGGGIESSEAEEAVAAYPVADGGSDWTDGPANLFRDRKARRPGDIVTILVDIDDRASLNNNSNRSRKAKSGGKFGLGYELFGVAGADVEADADADANTSMTGQGSTVRSEKVRASVAAVVVDVLPNGNLLVQGSQEVLVNFEKRVVRLSGIVNPRDVSSENVVSYGKVAEARIDYGGSGRITDVQKPAWGQQLWDRVSPF